jgi:hypothetical protein
LEKSWLVLANSGLDPLTPLDPLGRPDPFGRPILEVLSVEIDSGAADDWLREFKEIDITKLPTNSIPGPRRCGKSLGTDCPNKSHDKTRPHILLSVLPHHRPVTTVQFNKCRVEDWRGIPKVKPICWPSLSSDGASLAPP